MPTSSVQCHAFITFVTQSLKEYTRSHTELNLRGKSRYQLQQSESERALSEFDVL